MTYYQTTYPYPAAPYPAMAAPPPATRHSGLGIASLLIAVLTGFGIVALFVVCGVVAAGAEPGQIDEESALALLVGLAMFGSLMVALVGAALGIAGLVQSGRNRTFAAIGLTMNLLVFLGMFMLIAVSMMVGAGA